MISLLVRLYRYGPTWLGCWSFMQLEDVCAALAHSAQLSSSFWARHPEQCEALIEERVKSHSIGIGLVFFLFNLVWFYCMATLYLFCKRGRRSI